MEQQQLPLTVRRSIELLGLCGVALVIVVGKVVVMPLLIALFISILLLPLLRWLVQRRVPEVFAILLCIGGLTVVIATVALVLSYQIATLMTDVATIKINVGLHLQRISNWISSTLHYSVHDQLAMITKQADSFGENVASFVENAFASVGSAFVFFGLLPIYIFFMLFYRSMLLRFILMWFDASRHSTVRITMKEVEVIVKYYLGGLLIQITYLAVLVGGILFLFGIKHAVLIGITFAILNLIPYLGPLIGNLIGVALTLTSSQDIVQIGIVLVAIAVVQFFDNNIIMPRIVGSKVKVNALASIVGIVVGGAIAGIPGMFISIPTIAVLKILAERSRTLKPWGVLLGEADIPTDKTGAFHWLSKWMGKRGKSS
jgi:predicted PurR-regulated permease PerM